MHGELGATNTLDDAPMNSQPRSGAKLKASIPPAAKSSAPFWNRWTKLRKNIAVDAER